MAETTKLGKEVIPIELVGRNASYTELKVPEKRAYPQGDEVRYSDDYVSRLNEVYPLAQHLTEEKIRGIRARDSNTLNSMIMGSPLRCMEGEKILGYMLIRSTQAGSWHPWIIDVPHLTDTRIQTASEYLKEVDRMSLDSNRGMMEKGILFGLAVARRGNFAMPIEHDGKVIVIPSQEFVEFVL